jgi:hypothetical protein
MYSVSMTIRLRHQREFTDPYRCPVLEPQTGAQVAFNITASGIAGNFNQMLFSATTLQSIVSFGHI